MRHELPRHLTWVTPARYVGPAIVILFLALSALAAWLAIEGRPNEGILALLFAIGLLLLGIADLLGEIIMLLARSERPPEA